MTGTNPDDVLANIDAVLGVPHEVTGDWEVSGDAMRSIPVDETDLPDWEPPARDGAVPTFEVFDEAHTWSAAQILDLSAVVNPGGRLPYRRTMISHPRQAGRSALTEALRADQTDRVVLGFDGAQSDTSQAVRFYSGLWEPAEPPAVRSRLSRALTRTYSRLWNWWGTSRPRRVLRRAVGKATPTGGAITVTLTADLARFTAGMRGATAATTNLAAAMLAAGPVMRQAVEFARRYETTQAEMRAMYGRDNEPALPPEFYAIRALAQAHREAARLWFQQHANSVYADLGLERRTDAPLAEVDEDELIGYAHAPRVLATLREHQENRS